MLNEATLAALLLAISAAPAQGAETTTAPSRPAQQKAQAKERIYGSQLMTAEERDAYRAKMKSAKTQAERDEIRRQHHDEMQQRAKERGVTLPAEPRARPRAGQGGPEQRKGPGAPKQQP